VPVGLDAFRAAHEVLISEGAVLKPKTPARQLSAAAENLGRENLAKPVDQASYPFLRQLRPLAPHGEVIDTEELAIPSNLLPLRRHLVADDEPVVREVLERALHTSHEDRTVKSPY